MLVLCANQLVCLLFDGDLTILYFYLYCHDLGLLIHECNHFHTVSILINEDKRLRHT